MHDGAGMSVLVLDVAHEQGRTIRLGADSLAPFCLTYFVTLIPAAEACRVYYPFGMPLPPTTATFGARKPPDALISCGSVGG